jgi:hypothetical protein
LGSDSASAGAVGPNGRSRIGLGDPMLALLPKLIDSYCRIRPSDGAFCDLESLLCGEKFFKSKDHHTLGEEVGIPFRKVDFSMVPICTVGVAPDDERDLGSWNSIGTELALHCGARREVDLLRVRGWFLFAVSADRKCFLCYATRRQDQYRNKKLQFAGHNSPSL